jgi:hypothetical protein
MELGLDGVLPGREGDLFSVDPGLVGCCGEEGGGIDPEDDRGVPDRAAPSVLRVPVQATAVWFTSARARVRLVFCGRASKVLTSEKIPPVVA